MNASGRTLKSLNSVCFQAFQQELASKFQWSERTHFIGSVSEIPFRVEFFTELGCNVVDFSMENLGHSEAGVFIKFPDNWRCEYHVHEYSDAGTTVSIYAPSGKQMFVISGPNNTYQYSTCIELFNPDKKPIAQLFTDESLPDPSPFLFKK